MTVDRTRRIEELFHAALARPAGERPGFVREACGADDRLAEEVGSLLAAQATPVSPLERQPAPLLAAPAAPPRRLGPWALEEEIAHGGMGAVFRARRADGQYEQSVAVKLIQVAPFAAERDRQDLVRRFLDERQLLATLDHPHIARLLDGGAADDGTPWLAMELVEGMPIDRYCRERRLPRRQVLALFRDVCLAVQHAHGKLVAHRDLKPANILVVDPPRAGAAPVPKLLDFGIAKLLAAGPLDPAAEPATRTAARLTPAYASPEQFRGEPVTTATDVYSLGVVLYELLTGALPHAGAAPHELARQVCEAPPPPPGQLVPGLRGELETIVLKALEKAPARRYESAAALAADVERCLTGHPIAARPASAAYRFLKTVQRHKLPFAIAAGAFLALSASSLWMWRLKQDADLQRGTAEQRGKESDDARRVADEQRGEAVRRRAESEETAQLFVEMFGTPDPYSGGSEGVTVLQAMDRGLEAAAARLATRPQILVALRRMASSTYARIGRLDQSLAQARMVEEHFRTTLGPHDPETLVAELDVLRAVRASRDNVRTETLAQELLDRSDGVGGLPADFALEVRHEQAWALFGLGRLEDAGLLVEQLREEIARDLAPDSELSFDLDALRCELLLHRGRAEEAIQGSQELTERIRTRHGPDNYRLAETQSIHCQGLYVLGKHAECAANAEVLVRRMRDQFGAGHPLMLGALRVLSDSQVALGRLDAAAANQAEAIRLAASRFGEDDPMTWFMRAGMAKLLVARGDLPGAIAIQRDVLARQVDALGEADPIALTTRTNLAVLHAAQQEWDEADRLHQETLDLALDAGLAENHMIVAATRFARASSFARQRRFAEAEEQLLRSIEALRADAAGAQPDRLSQHRELLASVYGAWGKPLEAIKIRAQIPAAR